MKAKILVIWASLILTVFLTEHVMVCPTYASDSTEVSEASGVQLAGEARVLFEKEEYKLALEQMEKAVVLAPQSAYVQGNMGFMLVKLGQPARAVDYLQKAVNLDKTSAPLLQNLVMAYLSCGRLKEAIASIEEFFDRFPDSPFAPQMAVYQEKIKEEYAKQNEIASQLYPGSNKDYLLFTTASQGLVRWDSKKFPLKVFVESGDGIKGFQAEFLKQLPECFQAWSEAVGGKISFEMIPVKDSADIVVYWVDNVKELGSSAEAGQARVKFGWEGIKHCDVYILTVDMQDSRKLCSKNEIFGVCLHEIGHSLGLLGHSPNFGDVMFCADKGPLEKPAISPGDKATLDKLYSSPEVYAPSPSFLQALVFEKVRLFNLAVDEYNALNYATAVEKCQEALKLDRQFEQAEKLMANALDHMAVGLIKSQMYSQAEDCLKQTITVRKTLKGDQELSPTLHNYALVLRCLNKIDEADKVEAEAKSIAKFSS